MEKVVWSQWYDTRLIYDIQYISLPFMYYTNSVLRSSCLLDFFTDLDQSCVCQGILDMGLAFPRGVDRNGNVVGMYIVDNITYNDMGSRATIAAVVLNIRFHRKDNFQPIQLHQFVVYCLETHVSCYV